MNTILISGISMGAIASLAGLVLFWASRKYAVVEDPLIDEVEELLPGANCGGCGLAGCRAFAEEIVKTKDDDLRCPVCGAEGMRPIARLLGVEVATGPPMIARIMCQGGRFSVKAGTYQGIQSCSAATIANTLDLICPFGCLGYADCAIACPFEAIEIIDGVAVVNEEACTGCGNCIKTCPRNLIKLTPYDKKIYVACTSIDKGAVTKRYCKVGCTGCKLCLKACAYGAIEFKPFLSTILPDKCTECWACVEECPTDSIRIWKSLDEFREERELQAIEESREERESQADEAVHV